LNKIALLVEYNGGRYYGFQWQKNAPTIQAELERAISKLPGNSSRVIAASRTDTGVHARGQVVSFRTDSSLAPKTILKALNYYLPVDIAVRGARRVTAGVNVRRDALSREYEYHIVNRSTRSPLADGFALLVMKKLDIELMREACNVIKGEHDFVSFAASLRGQRSTVRTVYKADFEKDGDTVIFYMVANSFLPHQVRNTVGLMIKVGLGKVGIDKFNSIMNEKKKGLAGPAASPYALYLMKVNYPDNSELLYENLLS
jgi:tRNA pseudouridine38-40 synthase